MIYFKIINGKAANLPTQNHHKGYVDKLTKARRKYLLHVEIVKLLVNWMKILIYNLLQSSSIS